MAKFTQSIARKVGLVLGACLICASCSLVFSSGSPDPDAAVERDAFEPDAQVGPTARITVTEPGCGDNIYEVHGLASTSADGSNLTGYSWEIKQDGKDTVMFAGEGTLPVEPSDHILSGTVSQFQLRPSLFSASHVMRVTGNTPMPIVVGGDPVTNQVFQRNLNIVAGQSYELSFVASSFVMSSFFVQMILDGGTNANLGLSETVSTTEEPDTVRFWFEATGTTNNARLQMIVNTEGSYRLDKFVLRPIDGINLLNNGEIDGNLDNWGGNFSTGSYAFADMPQDFPDTVVTLKVVDAFNRESVAENITIKPPDCN